MTLKDKYLGEFIVIFETALGDESGDQVGMIHEKNQRFKISCTPLKIKSHQIRNAWK
jgi:hypothetical protein